MAKAKAAHSLTELFLALVRSGLWSVPLAPEYLPWLRSLDASSWDTLLDMARRQTVTGMLAAAVELLPEDFSVPETADYALMAAADRLEARHHRMERAMGKLTALFRDAGLEPVFLKGLESARLYPRPELRELGDIDLWFPPESFESALGLIRAHLGEMVSPASDGSLHFPFKGFDVDVHRHYFDLSCDAAALPAVPSPEAELLMLNAHILKHACSAGVGLRQCCDMALAYSRRPYDADRYEASCREGGILRWSRILSTFLNRYLEANAPLFHLPVIDPAPLERIVRRGGNFGHHGAGRRAALSRAPFLRKADTLWRMIGALPFSLRYAPEETLRYARRLLGGNLKAR